VTAAHLSSIAIRDEARASTLDDGPQFQGWVAQFRMRDVVSSSCGSRSTQWGLGLLSATGLEASPQLVADIVRATDRAQWPTGRGHFR